MTSRVIMVVSLLVAAVFAGNEVALQRMFARFDGSCSLYVSYEHGNDEWTGLAADHTHGNEGPLKTLAHAVDLAKSGSALCLREGTHVLTETLRLSAAHSGISFKGYSGDSGRPVVSVGRVISGDWKQTGNMWTLAMPETKGETAWYFRQLFANKRRLVRARTPNLGSFYTMQKPLPDNLLNLGFTFSDKEKIDPSWSCPESSQDGSGCVELMCYGSWSASRHYIDRVISSNSTVVFTSPTLNAPTSMFPNSGNRYYLENHRSFVDSDREWYLDQAAGELVYYAAPGDPAPTDMEFVAPVVIGDLVSIESAHDISFSGIDFNHVDWSLGREETADFQGASFLANSAVHIAASSNIKLTDVSVARVGSNGVWVESGSTNVALSQSRLYDLGAGGVRIGRGKPLPDEPADKRTGSVTVTDNVITSGSQVYHEGTGVLVQHSSGNTISHNDISYFGHVGISVGWNWGFQKSTSHDNIVEYNKVHDVGLNDLSDLACIYTLGISNNTIVRNNLVYRATPYYKYGHGIYLDEGSSAMVVDSNIATDNMMAGFYQHYGVNNVIKNNIWHGSRATTGGLLWQFAGGPDQPSRITFIGNIVVATASPFYVQEGYSGDGPYANNLYWNATSVQLTSSFPGDLSITEWKQLGNDIDSIVADPMFDPKTISLDPRSPAISQLGFRPIDTADIGPHTPGLFSEEVSLVVERAKGLTDLYEKSRDNRAETIA